MIDDTVAGYRTVRALAEIGGAQVFLTHPNSHEHVGVGSQSRHFRTEIRALKRFHASIPLPRILAEAECLSRASGDFVIAIDDLASATDGSPVLILGWVGSGSLRRLLRQRTMLRPGEAITILAPLLNALVRTHQAGVSMGNLSLDTVHFDEAGCPFFIDFSSAQLRVVNPTPRELQGDDYFREDRLNLANLAQSVLAAVRADREVMGTIRDLSLWLADNETTNGPDWQQQFETQLFALGAPEPLRLTADTAISSLARQAPARPLSVSAQIEARPSNEARSVLALPLWLDRQLGDLLRPVIFRIQVWRRAFADWCRPVRTRTWVLAAAAMVSILSCFVLIWLGSGDTTRSNDGHQQESQHAIESDSADELSRESSTRAADLQGDAQKALTVLLNTRAGCLRDLSVVCLEAVSPPGTPAYLSDRALIDSVLAGGELPKSALFDPAVSVEKQQFGDSVLFEFDDGDNSKPASVLLVKGEAGWRIRSYMLPG